MIRSFAAGKPVVLRDPTAERGVAICAGDFTRILTCSGRGALRGPARYSVAGTWPRGQRIRTVEWIVETLAAAWGAEAKWDVQAGQHSQEVPMLRLDCAKAAKELSWSPVLPTCRSLQMTVLDFGTAISMLGEKHRGNLAPRLPPTPHDRKQSGNCFPQLFAEPDEATWNPAAHWNAIH